MKEKYILKYRYMKYKFFGIYDEWKIKEYKAIDKNDLISEILRGVSLLTFSLLVYERKKLFIL